MQIIYLRVEDLRDHHSQFALMSGKPLEKKQSGAEITTSEPKTPPRWRREKKRNSPPKGKETAPYTEPVASQGTAAAGGENVPKKGERVIPDKLRKYIETRSQYLAAEAKDEIAEEDPVKYSNQTCSELFARGAPNYDEVYEVITNIICDSKEWRLNKFRLQSCQEELARYCELFEENTKKINQLTSEVNKTSELVKSTSALNLEEESDVTQRRRKKKDQASEMIIDGERMAELFEVIDELLTGDWRTGWSEAFEILIGMQAKPVNKKVLSQIAHFLCEQVFELRPTHSDKNGKYTKPGWESISKTTIGQIVNVYCGANGAARVNIDFLSHDGYGNKQHALIILMLYLGGGGFQGQGSTFSKVWNLVDRTNGLGAYSDWVGVCRKMNLICSTEGLAAAAWAWLLVCGDVEANPGPFALIFYFWFAALIAALGIGTEIAILESQNEKDKEVEAPNVINEIIPTVTYEADPVDDANEDPAEVGDTGEVQVNEILSSEYAEKTETYPGKAETNWGYGNFGGPGRYALGRPIDKIDALFKEHDVSIAIAQKEEDRARRLDKIKFADDILLGKLKVHMNSDLGFKAELVKWLAKSYFGFKEIARSIAPDVVGRADDLLFPHKNDDGNSLARVEDKLVTEENHSEEGNVGIWSHKRTIVTEMLRNNSTEISNGVRKLKNGDTFKLVVSKTKPADCVDISGVRVKNLTRKTIGDFVNIVRSEAAIDRANHRSLMLSGDVELNPGPTSFGLDPKRELNDSKTLAELWEIGEGSTSKEFGSGHMLPDGWVAVDGTSRNIDANLLVTGQFGYGTTGAGTVFNELPLERSLIPSFAMTSGGATVAWSSYTGHLATTYFQIDLRSIKGVNLIDTVLSEQIKSTESMYNFATQSANLGAQIDGATKAELLWLNQKETYYGADLSTLLVKGLMWQELLMPASHYNTEGIYSAMKGNTDVKSTNGNRGFVDGVNSLPKLLTGAGQYNGGILGGPTIDPFGLYAADVGAPTTLRFFTNLFAIHPDYQGLPTICCTNKQVDLLPIYVAAVAPFPLFNTGFGIDSRVTTNTSATVYCSKWICKWRSAGLTTLNVVVYGTSLENNANAANFVSTTVKFGPTAGQGASAPANGYITINNSSSVAPITYSLADYLSTWFVPNAGSIDYQKVARWVSLAAIPRMYIGGDYEYARSVVSMMATGYYGLDGDRTSTRSIGTLNGDTFDRLLVTPFGLTAKTASSPLTHTLVLPAPDPVAMYRTFIGMSTYNGEEVNSWHDVSGWGMVMRWNARCMALAADCALNYIGLNHSEFASIWNSQNTNEFTGELSVTLGWQNNVDKGGYGKMIQKFLASTCGLSCPENLSGRSCCDAIRLFNYAAPVPTTTKSPMLLTSGHKASVATVMPTEFLPIGKKVRVNEMIGSLISRYQVISGLSNKQIMNYHKVLQHPDISSKFDKSSIWFRNLLAQSTMMTTSNLIAVGSSSISATTANLYNTSTPNISDGWLVTAADNTRATPTFDIPSTYGATFDANVLCVDTVTTGQAQLFAYFQQGFLDYNWWVFCPSETPYLPALTALNISTSFSNLLKLGSDKNKDNSSSVLDSNVSSKSVTASDSNTDNKSNGLVTSLVTGTQ